jgi:DNA invertase Pin-like site-specific DNA recombinase
MATGKFVSYLRVSTRRQGESGLGLEAQRKAVLDWLNGGRHTLVAEFVEVESGKKNDRPQLAAALAMCRLHNATLVIAKLDRLSRDACFLLNLQKGRVRFVAVDMPEANEMVVGIMAVVAQAERKAISARTKAALAAAKAKGTRLGSPQNLKNRDVGSKRGHEAQSAAAAERVADLIPVIEQLRQEGHSSLRQLASALNEKGIPAPRGGLWNASGVMRVLRRA